MQLGGHASVLGFAHEVGDDGSPDALTLEGRKNLNAGQLDPGPRRQDAQPASGLTIHLGFVFGVVAAVLLWFVLRRTKWGFEIKLIGDNPRAARYAGINIARNIVIVFMVSGGLAGLEFYVGIPG